MTELLSQLLFDFVVCFLATLFYSILMSAPKRAVAPAGLIGALGYVIYDGLRLTLTGDVAACVIASLVIAIAGELFARGLKMPSTIFVFPAVIPLVPGVGLYKTMLCLIRDDFDGFLRMGAYTMFIAAAIAVPLAVINALFRRRTRLTV